MKQTLFLRGRLTDQQSVKIRYTNNGDMCLINTGITVNKKDWQDVQDKWLKPTAPNHITTNMNIRKAMATIQEYCDKFYFNNMRYPDSLSVKNYFEQKKDSTTVTLAEIQNKFLHSITNRDSNSISMGRLAQYNSGFPRLTAYDPDFITTLEAAYIKSGDSGVLKFYYGLKEFLRTKYGHGENTIAGVVTKLKTFLRWCNKNGYTTLPDKAIELMQTKWQKRDIIYHTEEELRALFALNLEDDNTLQKYLDCYLLQCIIGTRHSDTSEDCWQFDAQAEALRFVPKKTKRFGKDIYIKLRPEAVALISKYKERGEAFPTFTNLNYNHALKDIGMRAGITSMVHLVHGRKKHKAGAQVPKYRLMSSHVARATFICNLGQYQVPVAEIMRMTGLSMSSLQHYLEIAEQRISKTIDGVYHRQGDLRVTHINEEAKTA